MKQTEHQRIMKEVVGRKDQQISNVKELLQEEIDYWREESIAWCDRAGKAGELLDRALKEFENLLNSANNGQVIGPDENLMTEIKEHLAEVYH